MHSEETYDRDGCSSTEEALVENDKLEEARTLMSNADSKLIRQLMAWLRIAWKQRLKSAR